MLDLPGQRSQQGGLAFGVGAGFQGVVELAHAVVSCVLQVEGKKGC